MNVADLNKVWEIKALKKPGQEEAKKMLEKIAKQVQPIMRKHKWRVKVLSEFCPNNPSLLGLNVGAGVHVKLRLRRPNRDCDFYPFDQVLDTMLHELCHNVHGPHNANFYKLWDELRKECEEMMAKGITGTAEGFDLPGRRLGGIGRQPPLSSLHKATLAAAENRARLGSLLPSGPKRLGGDSAIMGALTPVQAAAMAAERRLQDDIWCGSQSCELSCDEDADYNIAKDLEHKEEKAGRIRKRNNSTLTSDQRPHKRNCESDPSFSAPSDFKYVDLTMDTTDIGLISEHQIRSQRSCSESVKTSCSRSYSQAGSSTADLSIPSSKPLPDNNGKLHSEESDMWQCLICTLLNRPLAPICELCGTEKPKDAATNGDTLMALLCRPEHPTLVLERNFVICREVCFVHVLRITLTRHDLLMKEQKARKRKPRRTSKHFLPFFLSFDP
ncbi:hypothetical protein K1719_023459 [Acacia pycnantha]|nr:hypothetical protein K1719_023459 [Acacia pycnantha]